MEDLLKSLPGKFRTLNPNVSIQVVESFPDGQVKTAIAVIIERVVDTPIATYFSVLVWNFNDGWRTMKVEEQ